MIYTGTYVSTSADIIKLAEQILIWKKHRISFYADDVINMMIDHGVIKDHEVKEIIETVNSKETVANLPNNHIGVL